MKIRRHWESNGIEFLGEYPVLESGKHWAVAKTPGGFLRYSDKEELEIFPTLEAALATCKVIPVPQNTLSRDGQGGLA